MDYYLAIDIGASSGRHMLFFLENGILQMEEIYRFENKMIHKDGHVFWDIDAMYQHVKQGIMQCKNIGKIPKSLGIDTWAVDYVLLDQNKQLLHQPYAYRDERTLSIIDEVHQRITKEQLYQKTGIQFQVFNSIYQLASEVKDVRKQAKHFLMIPDYLHYCLTGNMVNEYTNMSTTQLLSATTGELDESILQVVDIQPSIFKQIIAPGTYIGNLKKELVAELGFDAQVIVPATHDSACAYMGAIKDDAILLSSGTWSLLGVMQNKANTSLAAMHANFSNEGGYDGRYRFLKNIMGLWIIQEVARCYQYEYSYAKLVKLAKQHVFTGIFDVNDPRFLKPKHMVHEIQNYFKERDEKTPQHIGEIAYCVYHSLAHSYKQAIDELESITDKTYTTINVVGGGCKNELLNELLAILTNKEVIAGPSEATAIGNVLCQCIADHKIQDMKQAQQIIKQSFEITHYKGEAYDK